MANHTAKDIKYKLQDAHELRVKDLGQSIQLAKDAFSEAEEIGSEELKAESLSKLSLFYMIIGQNESSLETARKSIGIYQKLGDRKGIADAKYSIAGTYYKTDQFHLGMAELEDCLIIYREFEDHFNQARVQKSMGTIYEYFGDVKSAIQAYENSIECGKKIGNKNIISNAFNPLSGIYLNGGNFQLAIDLIEEAIQMKQETDDLRGLAFSLYGRGKIYTETKNFAQAEKDLLESLKIHESTGERLGLAMCCRKLASMYVKKGDLGAASDAAHKGLEIASKYNIAIIKSRLYHLLYEIHKIEGNQGDALKFLELHTDYKEEIMSSRSMKMIKSFEVVNRLNDLEYEAKSQKEKAEIVSQKNRELDTFFHRVCHDLRGPLSNLIGMEEFFREETSDPKVIDYLDSNQRQLTRINHILTELIKLTKVSHEHSEDEFIDFEELITSCYQGFKSHPNAGKINFDYAVEKGLKYKAPWVLVNTICQNLIENGIKYARLDQEHPLLQIRVSQFANSLKISVTDNGIGIDQYDGENIFDMFYRASKSNDGSGLGLYILNRAVERLHGQVSVMSELKMGSTFTVMLPMN